MLLFVDKLEFQILKTFILRFHVNLELNKRLKLIFKFFFRRKDMNSFLIINVNLIMLFNCIYIWNGVYAARTASFSISGGSSARTRCSFRWSDVTSPMSTGEMGENVS